MKKTFELTHHKIAWARLVEAARHDVKKYLKRERKKTLPPDVDFWDFDCRFGHTAEESEVIHVSEISKRIDEVQRLQLTSFYIEIVAKEGHRTKNKGPDEQQ